MAGRRRALLAAVELHILATIIATVAKQFGIPNVIIQVRVWAELMLEDGKYLLENEAGFDVLSLPSIAQSTSTFDLGNGRIHTREKGDLLHPAHEPAEVLREIKKNMGSMLFSAQYQQAPEPAGEFRFLKMVYEVSAQITKLRKHLIVRKRLKSRPDWRVRVRESEVLHGRAEICRKLAAKVLDEEIKRKLLALADEYEAKATQTGAAVHLPPHDG